MTCWWNEDIVDGLCIEVKHWTLFTVTGGVSEESEVFSNRLESSSKTDFLDNNCWAMADGWEGLMSKLSLEDWSLLEEFTLCCLVRTSQDSYFSSNLFSWSLSSIEVSPALALVLVSRGIAPDSRVVKNTIQLVWNTLVFRYWERFKWSIRTIEKKNT